MKKFLIFFLFILIISTPQKSAALECLELSSNLKHGMRNREVVRLQDFLKEKGHFSLNSTGYFGVQTLKAVKSLQKNNNLPPTGFVGPLTRALIKDLTCVSEPVPTPTQPSNAVVPSVPSTATEPTTPHVVADPTPTPVVEDIVLPIGNPSSLRVRTEGIGGVSKDSIIVKGVITSGVRSGTVSWFELTKNPDVYKKSETTISKSVIQRINDRSFQETFTGLQSNTIYYFRVCAGNDGLGQRSCGTTVSVKTLE